MKRIYVYAISFVTLSVLFTACYFFSYRFALSEFNKNATQRTAEISDNELLDIESVNVGNKETVTPDTKYILQKYDLATKEFKEEEQNIPNEFIGYTREEVVNYLNNYSSNLSLEEYNNGFVSFQLQSFSSEKVIVKKTFNSQAILYKYYIAIRDSMVVVYYSDKKTVYDDTDICVTDLPEEEQDKLLYGIYVKDDEELYGILESYSS